MSTLGGCKLTDISTLGDRYGNDSFNNVQEDTMDLVNSFPPAKGNASAEKERATQFGISERPPLLKFSSFWGQIGCMNNEMSNLSQSQQILPLHACFSDRVKGLLGSFFAAVRGC